MGSDDKLKHICYNEVTFQSTLPAWGATKAPFPISVTLSDFNPRSPRGERRFVFRVWIQFFSISIHAPRVGSDNSCLLQPTRPEYFNPRSPRGERLIDYYFGVMGADFNPRSPRGERRRFSRFIIRLAHFNPRSPRGERPSKAKKQAMLNGNFNPRSPRGERLQIK